MTTNEKRIVVTIDGPAASGKSTTAREVAKRLQWLYLDTGAMYRAMAVKTLKGNVSLDDADTIGALAETTQVELMPSDKGARVFLDGEEITGEIRNPEIDRAVGPVCEVNRVREVMVALQRKLGEKGNVVAEGRDMGTVVFPDAPVKIFMSASIEGRARRRKIDLDRQGIEISLEEIMNDIERRDKRDSSRANSPLTPADDAIHLDTTTMTIDEQVNYVIDRIHEAKGRE